MRKQEEVTPVSLVTARLNSFKAYQEELEEGLRCNEHRVQVAKDAIAENEAKIKEFEEWLADHDKPAEREIKFDLTIKKTPDGWDTAVCGDGLSVGTHGESPQRAVLRLALALIAKPKDMPQLERLFAVDDPAVKQAIIDAENAVRAIERQISGGICSVEQCQQADGLTVGYLARTCRVASSQASL